ncbi:MAG: multiheme c-type cytochrome, partial [Gemmataceae bacterium]
MRLLFTAALIGVPLALSLAPLTRSDDRPALTVPTPKTLGVATCASMACHHGNGDLGSQGSEYSTWIAVDPHAKAYRALFNADSLRIQENLGPGKAHENPTCLACHGMGAGLPPALNADGAGCEQCHGPAEHWKSTH